LFIPPCSFNATNDCTAKLRGLALSGFMCPTG
jgi:hypothetical protein